MNVRVGGVYWTQSGVLVQITEMVHREGGYNGYREVPPGVRFKGVYLRSGRDCAYHWGPDGSGMYRHALTEEVEVSADGGQPVAILPLHPPKKERP